ncbi:hypothetical protein BAE52_11475 [Pseudomonas sp. EGD-AKN5]|nr:hypothetical protein BAE52_11475 [Pseudomonas sp. EGD-AKN5]
MLALDLARACDVARPAEVIRVQLQAVEKVLASHPGLCEQVPQVVAAVRHSAEPFARTFG